MSRSNILVTGPELADAAVTHLNAAGYEVVCIPPYTEADALTAYIADSRPVGIIARMGRLNADAIAAAEDLKVISKHGVGVDNIDVDAATARAIPVVVAYAANAQSVAEHAMALLLAAVKRLLPLDQGLRAGRWEKPGFSGREMAGGRLALIGFGAIARQTAALARAFDLDIVAYDPYADDALFQENGVARAQTVAQALADADFVSLHCPLTPGTRHLINRDSLAGMKRGAYLVNTARGGLIDEAALLDALRSGQLAGAGLDTFESEPPRADHPFWNEQNLVLSPHIGGVTAAANTRVALEAAKGIVDVLEARPIESRRVINREALRNAPTGPALV